MFVHVWTICTKRMFALISIQHCVLILSCSAQSTDEEISNYQMEVSSIYHNLQDIERVVRASKKSVVVQQIVKNVSMCDFTSIVQMINSLPSSEMINYTRYNSYDDSKWVKLDLINCVNMDEKQIMKLLSKVGIGIVIKLIMNMMND